MGLTADQWLKIGSMAASLGGGLVAGKKAKNAANEAAGGARLQQLMPLIMQMMQQQQQIGQQNYQNQVTRSQTNYGNQVAHAQAQQPLQDAVRRMALNILPSHVKSGMASPSYQPAAAPAPQAPVQPMQAAAAAQPLPSVGDIMEDYGRRGGGTGGALKGAVTGASAAGTIAPFTGPAAPFVLGAGALAGMVGGLAKKRASTAPTDFKVDDARSAIANAIQAYQGRTAAPDEIEGAIRGQGWEPGDRWVGEKGLRFILQQIKSQAAPR